MEKEIFEVKCNPRLKTWLDEFQRYSEQTFYLHEFFPLDAQQRILSMNSEAKASIKELISSIPSVKTSLVKMIKNIIPTIEWAKHLPPSSRDEMLLRLEKMTWMIRESTFATKSMLDLSKHLTGMVYPGTVSITDTCIGKDFICISLLIDISIISIKVLLWVYLLTFDTDLNLLYRELFDVITLLNRRKENWPRDVYHIMNVENITQQDLNQEYAVLLLDTCQKSIVASLRYVI